MKKIYLYYPISRFLSLSDASYDKIAVAKVFHPGNHTINFGSKAIKLDDIETSLPADGKIPALEEVYQMDKGKTAKWRKLLDK